MQANPRIGYLTCLLAAFVWSGTGPLISYLLDTHGVAPLVVAFWRDALIAVTCLVGIVALRPAWLRLSRSDLQGFALVGTISIGIYHAIFVTSIALNGTALAVVLIYLYPAFVTLGSAVLFKEQVGARHIIGLLLALVGCVLLVGAYDPAALSVSWLGILVGVASALTHAVYVLFSQRSVTRHSPWVSLAFTMLFGALVLLVLTLTVEGPRSLLTVGTDAWPWLVLAFLALGPTLFGYFLFTSSLRHIPGRIASLLLVLEAPIATLIAVIFLGDRLSIIQIIGMALILVAAVLPGLPLTFRRTAAQAA
jgi:drug/metabolite transporter, DME family